MTDKQIPNERRQYEYKSVFTYTDNTTDDNDKIMENLHKQIIFDDVDVKDCIAYAKSQTVYLGNTVYKQMEKICMVKNQPCKFFDCQFKQMARELKAKEQECEELKRENELAKQLINWILKFFELTDYDWQDDQNEISALIEDYIDDKNSTIDFVNDINKGLFKKLTEIKEIAKNGCYDDCGMPLDELSIILQKISECEGNDEK